MKDRRKKLALRPKRPMKDHREERVRLRTFIRAPMKDRRKRPALPRSKTAISLQPHERSQKEAGPGAFEKDAARARCNEATPKKKRAAFKVLRTGPRNEVS